MKIRKKKIGGVGGGVRGRGRVGGGVRVDVNEELKFFKKKIVGGSGGSGESGGRGVGGSVWGVRVDVNEELKFLGKFKKKKKFGGGGGRVGGQDGCERRIKVFVKIQKKNGGGWSGGSGLGGVRVDVNEELKFL